MAKGDGGVRYTDVVHTVVEWEDIAHWFKAHHEHLFWRGLNSKIEHGVRNDQVRDKAQPLRITLTSIDAERCEDAWHQVMTTRTTANSSMLMQIQHLQAKYAENLLLFRLGDFYEAYFHDALVLGDILQRPPRMRRMGRIDVEVSGFPKAVLDETVGRLIELGFKVLVLEQEGIRATTDD